MYMANEAIMFPAGSEIVKGRENIFSRMQKSADSYILNWQPQRAEVSESKDLGWTWGKYTLTSWFGNRTEQQSYGKYVNIWKKQSDGSWKVIVDIGNDTKN